MSYPYYGAYMPNYYQPIQGYQINQPISQPVINQPQTINSQQNGNQSNFFCRPVATKEEMLAVPVDFMGSPMFFPDLAHGVVYMKRFNSKTGESDISVFYDLQAKEQVSKPDPSFAPLDEFNAIKETIQRLQSEIDQLKKPTGRLKKTDVPDE